MGEDVMATEARQRVGLPTGFLSDRPSRDGDLRWYAIHVPEGREDAVAGKCRQLLGSDLVEDCFVPKYERYMKREGAWRIVVHPMFSEYVFVSTRDVRA
ncbi:transcription termination/antitermination NusG family protein, partial [Gordonibacter pamelaeae]|uniref:transcription termination/antitermination NusG family protein n=1 Tax=Gordonibacter pamelaeae TaxID=471189 RepID=UPI003A9442C6